jgi:hypothetical protein
MGVVAVVIAVLALALAGAGWYFWGVETVIVTVPADAKVLLDDGQLSAESPGRFVVSHLARRRHTLTVRRTGYAEVIQTLDFPLASLTEWVNIRMTPSAQRSR